MKKKKPKRRLGWLNERDKNGWRVPRPGTLSRDIYDMLNMGITHRQISEGLNVDLGMVRVLSHRFRNPDWSNARRT